VNRTPGSWLLGTYDQWEVHVKVERPNGKISLRRVPCWDRKQAEERLRLVSENDTADLFKRCRIKGKLVEVVGVFRTRSLFERIDVKPKQAASRPGVSRGAGVPVGGRGEG
jgi:hypothetical protein